MAEYDVVVIGGAGIDTIISVPALPVPLKDTVHVPPIESYLGHTGNGMALGCNALGLRTMFADLVGDDIEGHRIIDRHRDIGVAFRHRFHPSGTKRSVNLVDSSGSRMSFYDGRGHNDLEVDASLYAEGIAAARHVHVSIIGWGLRALESAVDAGVPTSTDLHDWDGASPYHLAFARLADIVFLSTATLRDRREAAMRRILDEGRARVVVGTAGPSGSYLIVRGAEMVHVPAVRLPDRPVVDSNGAGDAYACSFLHTFLADGSSLPTGERGLASWLECARAGAVGGAYACGTPGTHTSLITAKELAGYLAEPLPEP